MYCLLTDDTWTVTASDGGECVRDLDHAGVFTELPTLEWLLQGVFTELPTLEWLLQGVFTELPTLEWLLQGVFTELPTL